MTKSSQRVEMREMNREEDQTNNEIKQKARERYYFKSLSTSLTVFLKLFKRLFHSRNQAFPLVFIQKKQNSLPKKPQHLPLV